MRKVAVARAARRFETPYRARWLLVSSLLAVATLAAPVRAEDPIYANGGFAGIDLGVSRPTNANYNAHVHDGATANPFVGYMFNHYLGLQGQVYATFQEPDNDHRGYAHENQITSLLGVSVGPRLALPLQNDLELYATFQVGGWTGLSGTMDETAPGFSTGAGLNYFVTPQVAIGAFGRWNRVYMSPRPVTLTNPPLVADQQGPADAQFAMGGISLTYHFNRPEAPPPAPPPAAAKVEPPPEPPVKKAIVLRAVHFDFNKADIRPEAIPVLDEAAAVLNNEGSVGVIVVGHTDGIGGDAYNVKLSKRRADAVAKYLTSHGVNGKRIKTEGAGKAHPVASNDTPDGRAQNRRVELHVQ